MWPFVLKMLKVYIIGPASVLKRLVLWPFCAQNAQGIGPDVGCGPFVLKMLKVRPDELKMLRTSPLNCKCSGQALLC